jgi:hypothetical protein
MSEATSRTGIKNERRTLQIEGERNSVGADGNALSDTVEVIDFVPVICQFVCGG